MKCLTLLLTLSLAAPSFAAPLTYHCVPAANNSITTEFVLVVSGTSLILKDATDGKNYPMTLDTAYHPRANNVDLNRYSCGYSFDDGYSSAFMVSKGIAQGQKSGIMKIFSSGEGFFNDFFTCNR